MYQLLDPLLSGIFCAFLFMSMLLLLVITQSPYEDCGNRFTRWTHTMFSEYTPSVIFWNYMYWTAFIFLLLTWPVTALCISGLGSIILIITGFGYFYIFRNHSWPFSTFLYWIVGLISFIIASLIWLYTNTIIRFNRWLDAPSNKSHENNNSNRL